MESTRSSKAVEKKFQDILNIKKHLDLVDYSVSNTFGKVKYKININEKALKAHVDTLGKSYFLSNHPDIKPLEVVWLY